MKLSKYLTAAFFVTTALVSHAQTFQVFSSPPILVGAENRTIGGRAQFGGCYAKFAPGVITLNSCNSEYVTFGCSADGNLAGAVTKSGGSAAFNQANLAFVMGRDLKVRIVNTAGADGMCLAINAQVAN